MRALLLVCLTLLLTQTIQSAAAWCSVLYPENWQPNYSDKAGHFLHDFSYAGYHSGERPIPDMTASITDVTQPPYNADATGATDSTEALQKALDAIGLAGGGVVYLPPGIYNIAPRGTDTSALTLRDNHVILRGAGSGRTFLCNTSTTMRGKSVIATKPRLPLSWNAGSKEAPGVALTSDLLTPTRLVPVVDTAAFAVGELVVIRNTMTQHYIDLLHMTGQWIPGRPENSPLAYCRRIIAIDSLKQTLLLDLPLRGFLYIADNARIVPTTGKMLSEIGLEDFSIGMRQHPGSGLANDDFTKPGTLGYEVDGSIAIALDCVEDSWVRRIHTYAPEWNTSGSHVLSNALKLLWSTRLITVSDCDFRSPQYRGGGGNGYLYCLYGQDHLIRDCRAQDSRHNYSFGMMTASGNVLLDCIAKDGELPSDFHMYLSLANLIDNVTCDGDFLEASAFRPWGYPIHGVTTTQSVFWNTNGLRYAPYHRGSFPALIYSHQFGNGYIIGTRGPASAVDSDNFMEGVGAGDTLQPRSLYLDQLRKRLSLSDATISP